MLTFRVPAPIAEQPTLVESLRHFWYPVARSADIRERPRAVRVLDQPAVVWRGADGTLSAFYDWCIHRGRRYRSAGSTMTSWCAHTMAGPTMRVAPARASRLCPLEHGIPTRARATAFRACERYGLVWVFCLEEPAAGIPPSQLSSMIPPGISCRSPMRATYGPMRPGSSKT